MKNLGKRMKFLEDTNEILLKENIPVIIKLENKGINNFMKKNISILEDHLYFLAMRSTMEYMCKNIPNCKFAYTQTNEIYLLFTNFTWFNRNIQNIISRAASMATLHFNRKLRNLVNEEKNTWFSYRELELDDIMNEVFFTCKAFNLYKDEVCNYFILKQETSLQKGIIKYGNKFFDNTYFKNYELETVNDRDKFLKLINNEEKIISYNNLPLYYFKGFGFYITVKFVGDDYDKLTLVEYVSDTNLPLFKNNREFINKFVI